MPYNYVQAGKTLRRVSSDGTNSTVPLLPNLTLSTTSPPRFAISQGRVCITNSPSFNVMVVPGDPLKGTTDEMVPMSPTPPLRAAVLAAGTSTGLSGVYGVRVSFAVKDFSTGAVLSESPLGPPVQLPAASSLVNETLAVSGIPIPNEGGINCRRLYRTLTQGGGNFYHWADIDNITDTTFEAAISDEVLSQSPAPLDGEVGNPPGSFGSDSRLDLLTSWKGRLFGAAQGSPFAAKDSLIWSEVGHPDRWPATNFVSVSPVNSDEVGITGLFPLRDVLGIAKRDTFHVIADVNAAPRQIAAVGSVSHSSGVTHENSVWFISSDGAYQWDSSNQVHNISRAKCHSWFTKDDEFNRAAFNKIVGIYSEARQSVMWLMPSANQTSLDKWIEYYPESQCWLGPHCVQFDENDVAVFVPSTLGKYSDENGLERVVVCGQDGNIYREDSKHYDGSSQGMLIEPDDDTRRDILDEEFEFTIPLFDHTWVATNVELSRIYPKAFPDTGRIEYEELPDVQIILKIDGTVSASPIISWRNVLPLRERQSVPPNDGGPVTLPVFAVLMGQGVALMLGISEADVLHFAFAEPASRFTSSAATATITSVNTAQSPSSQIARAAGVPMVVETQTQTLGEADLTKYFGELDILAKIDAGHRLAVTTCADKNEREHKHDFPVEFKARLGRIGVGHQAQVILKEDSTATVDFYGYHIWPVNVVGNRQRG